MVQIGPAAAEEEAAEEETAEEEAAEAAAEAAVGTDNKATQASALSFELGLGVAKKAIILVPIFIKCNFYYVIMYTNNFYFSKKAVSKPLMDVCVGSCFFLSYFPARK